MASTSEKINVVAVTITNLAVEIRTVLREAHDRARSLYIERPSSGTEFKQERSTQDPLITDRQKQLYWFWEHFGVIGLAYWISEIARYERDDEASRGVNVNKRKRDTADEVRPGGHSSWNKVVDDFDTLKNSRAIFYLSSLPPELIPTLIRGDLPSEMQDPVFKAKVCGYVELLATQGTYSVTVSKSSAAGAARSIARRNGAEAEVEEQSNVPMVNNTGRGLTYRNSMKIVDGMRLYIDLEDPASEALARAIDCHAAAPNEPLDYKQQRRFAGGSLFDDFSTLEEWLDNFEHCYLAHARHLLGTDREYLLDEHSLRCLSYVGLSSNVKVRAPTHWYPGITGSRLLGLFLSTIRHFLGDEFDVKESTYQIFRTVQIDDICLDEVLTAILTSAHRCDGGLNYSWTGGSKGNTDRSTVRYLQGLRTNQQMIKDSGFQEVNIRDSCEKIDSVSRQYSIALENDREMEEHREETQKLSDRIEKAKQEVEWLQAADEYATLQSALSSLQIEDEQRELVEAFDPEHWDSLSCRLH